MRRRLVPASGARGIQIAAYVEVDGCFINVSVNSQGKPPADFDRVSVKFYRRPGTRGGDTGLGLSVSRGIVVAHGGAISCTNRPEGEAQFTLRLPLGSPPPSVVTA